MGASIQYPGMTEPLAPSVEQPAAPSHLQPQQRPVPHRRYQGLTQTTASFPASPVAYDPAGGLPWPPPQQPVPHKKFRPESSCVLARPPSLLEETTQITWRQPQQPPVPHKKFRHQIGPTERIGWEQFAYDVSSGFPWPVQQRPVRHRRFVPPSSVVYVSALDVLDASGRLRFEQPQQRPVPHRRFTPPSGAPVAGADEQTLPGLAPALPLSPQQRPVPHRRFVPASQTAAGRGPDLVEQVLFVSPAQQGPVARRRFVPAPAAVAGVSADALPAFPFPPQQTPTPRRRFAPASTTVYIRPPSLLELAPVEAWAIPAARPSHRRFYPASEVVAAPLTISALPQFSFPPQSRPLPHRRSPGGGLVVLAAAPSAIEGPALALWVQPQQQPTPHRRFGGVGFAAAGAGWLQWPEGPFAGPPTVWDALDFSWLRTDDEELDEV